MANNRLTMQDCKRQWYKVLDPGGSENSGRIVHSMHTRGNKTDVEVCHYIKTHFLMWEEIVRFGGYDQKHFDDLRCFTTPMSLVNLGVL